MKAKTVWSENFKSVVDNGRGHSVNLDLPESQNGTDTGATALEVCVMSYSGCIATIFAMMAKKMRLEFTGLEVVSEAEKSAETGTIGTITSKVSLVSAENAEKLQKCLDRTVATCPVGVLYKNAGVKVDYSLEVLATAE
jgi:putative redox protein